MDSIVRSLFQPARFFRENEGRPGWIGPFISICLISMFCAWLTLPFVERAVALSMEPSMNSTAASDAAAATRDMRLIGIALVPLERLVRWGFVSLLLFTAVRMLSAAPVTFRTVFAIVIWSQMVFAVMTLLNVAVLHLRGLEGVTHSMDLNALPGLDLFLSNKVQNKVWYTVLSAVNPFTLWYAFVLATGLTVAASLTPARSYGIVFGLWLTGIAFEVTMVIMTQRLVAGAMG